jgi:signal transduction histidine kinase/CheY-like chemotaxis protein
MKKSVLLIDDEFRYRETVKYLLRDLPINLIETESPDEGIAILRENPDIRVILLDLSFEPFGSIGAPTVLEMLKERADDYRVIVLTSHEDLLVANQAREYRVFNYLPKTGTEALRFSVEQAFRDLDREDTNRKVRSFLEVQKKINANEGMEATLDHICRSVKVIVGAYTCHIRVYDIEYGDYRLMGFAGAEEGQRDMFRTPKAKGNYFSGHAVESKAVLNISDLHSNIHFRQIADAALSDETTLPEQRRYFRTVRSAYLIPIYTGLFGGGVDAVLNVSAEEPAFFDEARADIVGEFAALATLAITKIWSLRIRKEIHRDYSQIGEMLSKIGRLTGPDVLPRIYDTVMEGISQIVNPEVISIFRYDESTLSIENVAEFRGGRRVKASVESYKPGESLIGAVFQNKETIQLPDPEALERVKPLEDKRYDHTGKEGYLDNIPSRKVEHYLGVPIRIGEEVLGVLRAMNKKSKHYGRTAPDTDRFCLLERGFSGDCRNALEITASHLAVAIRHEDLLKEKELQVEQLGALGKVANDRLDRIQDKNANLLLLVRAVAHEINNTSGLIPVNVESIRRLIKVPDKRIDRSLSRINAAASQATEFANKIGDFAPKRMGGIVSRDINEAVVDAIDTLDLSNIENAERVKRTVRLYKGDDLVCDIYSTFFIVVVRNILINAYQALRSTPNAAIKVSTSKGVGELEGSAVILVSDNGPGIKAADQPKIFDPTFSTKGTGIGLWLARTGLDLIDGKIGVESEFGKGASFLVSVPLRRSTP